VGRVRLFHRSWSRLRSHFPRRDPARRRTPPPALRPQSGKWSRRPPPDSYLREIFMAIVQRYTLSDLVGTTLSLLCIVHCLAMPLVFAYLPHLGLAWLARDGFHGWVAAAAAFLGAVSFTPGYLRHRRVIVPVVGSAGLLLLCYATLCHDQCCRVPVADPASASECAKECCDSERSTVELATVRSGSLPWLDLPWTPIGGLLLMIAHTLNCRWSRCCESSTCRVLPIVEIAPSESFARGAEREVSPSRDLPLRAL